MQTDPPTDDRLEIRATADGSVMLFDRRVAEGYHSQRGAESEARHVFVEGSGAATRAYRGQATRIVEIGFGSGLNFLRSAEAFAAGETRLDYLGIDPAPPPWPLLTGLSYLAPPEILLAWRHLLRDAREQAALPAGGSVRLLRRDALAVDPDAAADIVFLDAFSPGVAPALWSDEALARWTAWLRPGGMLVSYCVQGRVRRSLEALGLSVQRRPGPPGGKRECLSARRPTPGGSEV